MNQSLKKYTFELKYSPNYFIKESVKECGAYTYAEAVNFAYRDSKVQSAILTKIALPFGEVTNITEPTKFDNL